MVVARGLKRRPDDSDEPYRDGHRWTPPVDDDAEPVVEGTVDDGSESDDADLVPAGSAGEVSDAEATEQSRDPDDRSISPVSDEPAEDPPAS